LILTEQSNQLYAARTLAIVCTVAAHMPTEGVTGRILALMGTMGVPFFLFAAGLMFRQTKRHVWLDFLKKCGIAWVLSGTIMWFIGHRLGYTQENWFFYLLGRNSYLYFLTILLILEALFSYLPIKIVPWALGLGLIQMIIVHIPALQAMNGNLYLSPLFWLPYFAAGLLLQCKGARERFLRFCSENSAIIFVLFVYLAFQIVRSGTINYFTWSAIPFSAVTICALMSLGSLLGSISLAVDIGKRTLAIYLWHIYVAGRISGSLMSHGVLALIGPWLATGLMYAIICLGHTIADRLKSTGLYCKVIGDANTPITIFKRGR